MYKAIYICNKRKTIYSMYFAKINLAKMTMDFKYWTTGARQIWVIMLLKESVWILFIIETL